MDGQRAERGMKSGGEAKETKVLVARATELPGRRLAADKRYLILNLLFRVPAARISWRIRMVCSTNVATLVCLL